MTFDVREMSLTESNADTLELAVRYLGVLRAIEITHAVGDNDEILYLLGNVDRTELTQVIDEVEGLRDRYRHTPIKVVTHG